MNPKKFKKKVTSYEAMQYDGSEESRNVISEWIRKYKGRSEYSKFADAFALTNSGGAREIIRKESYVVKGSKIGDGFDVYSKGVFEKCFEEVEMNIEHSIRVPNMLDDSAYIERLHNLIKRLPTGCIASFKVTKLNNENELVYSFTATRMLHFHIDVSEKTASETYFRAIHALKASGYLTKFLTDDEKKIVNMICNQTEERILK